MNVIVDRLHDSRKQHDLTVETRREIVRAYTVGVDSSTTPAVTGRPGYIWVRERGGGSGVFQVLNSTVAEVIDLPVLIGYTPNKPFRRMVIGLDVEQFAVIGTYSGNPYLPHHGASHEWPDGAPNNDVVSVYPRALTPLRTYAVSGSGLSVAVAAALYTNGNATVIFGGDYDVDLSGDIPVTANKSVAVLLYVDPDTNAIVTLAGSEYTTGATPDFPTIPDSVIPSAFVELHNGTAQITEADITDARVLFGSGSSSGISIYYVDPASPTDGDIWILVVSGTAEGELWAGMPWMPFGSTGSSVKLKAQIDGETYYVDMALET